MNFTGDQLAPAPPKEGYLRVAAVQLEFLPATDQSIDDPLFTLEAPHSLLPSNGLWDVSVLDRLEQLRERIRVAYVDQLWLRIEWILIGCKKASVRAVVFPEYSVPPELLPRIAASFEDIVVLAGTHLVSAVGLASGVYEQLRSPPPLLNEAVCPILHKGRVVQYVSKLSASKWEKGLNEASSWAPIELDDPCGKTAVLICLDFLHTQDSKWAAVVQPGLTDCRWIAVPSLTPRGSAEADFPARAREQSRRYKQPVVHANWANAGGTCVYVDADSGDEQPLALPAESEGVLMVDIDTLPRPAGRSTAYETRAAVSPVSRPTLAYASNDSTYLNWLTEWANQITSADTDEAKRLSASANWLRACPPDLKGSALRRERLARLQQDRGRWRSAEELKRLAWEVRLPPMVLPFPSLRSALTQGALAQIEAWLPELPTGASRLAAGEVIERLKDRLSTRREALSAEGSSKFAQVVHAVRGETPPLLTERREIVRLFVEGLDEDLKEWHSLAQRGDYRAALTALELLISKLEDAVTTSADPQIRERLIRARLRAAGASLNLGDLGMARSRLGKVEASQATVSQRITLAELFACLGDSALARTVLPPATDVGSNEEAKQRAAVEQSLLIFENALPQGDPATTVVALRLCGLLLNLGHTRECKTRLAALLTSTDATVTERAVATELLRACLEITAEDTGKPGAERLSDEEAAEAVQELERRYVELRNSEISGAARTQLDRSEYHYRLLSWDFDWIADHPEIGDEDQRNLSEAMDLARAGKLDEALASLTPDDHPWANDLVTAGLVAASGDLTHAASIFTRLRERFPLRPRIEATYAQLCDRLGRPQDALEASRRAAAALPSAGFLLPYAQKLFAAGRPDEAIYVLSSLALDTRPRTLLARARLLSATGDVTGAEDAYRGYLSKRPSDSKVRFSFAKLLWMQHRYQESAALAWGAFEQDGSSLSADDLWFVAESQKKSGFSDREVAERKRRLVLYLQERRAVEPDAERVRASLLLDNRSISDSDDSIEPLDFPLLEKLGVVQSHPVEDLEPMIAEWSQTASSSARLYAAGQIGLLEALHHRRLRIAEYLVAAGQSDVEPTDLLVPPFDISARAPGDLSGIELVLTAIEFNLLVHLGILDNVIEALGSDGKLILPDVDRDCIVNDASALSKLGVGAGSTPVERLIVGIADGASAHNGAIFGEGASPATQEHIFFRWLVREGLLESFVSGDDTSGTTTGDPKDASFLEELPALDDVESISIGSDVLGKLIQEGWAETVIPSLRATKPNRLRLSPDIRRSLERDRRREDMKRRAADLADSAHQRLAEGLENRRIVVRSLPRVPDGPFLRAGAPESVRALFIAPVERALAVVRLAAAGSSKRRRLNAEFFSSVAPSSLETLRWIGWRNADHYLAIARELREAAESDLHLPALARVVLRDDQERRGLLERLGLMGFPDALDASDILDIADRFDAGIAAPRVRRLLGRTEWVAGVPHHVGNPIACLRLSTTYAEALFTAFCGDGRRPPNRNPLAFAQAILGRLEDVDLRSGRATLSTGLGMLLLKAVERPEESWSPSGSSTYSLDPDGRAAAMWGAIWPWLESSGSRRASYARASIYSWVWIQERGAPQRKRNSGTLWQALAPARMGLSPHELLRLHPVAAIAILSSCWPEDERPLKIEAFGISQADLSEEVTLSIEDILQAGVRALETREGISGDDTRLEFPVPPIGSDSPLFRIAAPVEAVALRSENSEVVAAVARQWRVMQGRHDGVAYKLLAALEQAPSDTKRREAVARHAAISLWRQVREDPAYLLRWPDPFLRVEEDTDHFGQLCQLLSEPLVDLPETVDLSDVLRERCQRGDWSGRDDVGGLVLLAASVPGTLPLGMARSLVDGEEAASHVLAATKRLAQHTEQPVGQLALDVLVLRMAAARQDVFRDGRDQVNLASELPSLLARMLGEMTTRQSVPALVEPDRVAPRPEPSLQTLASAESGLLRICLSLVERLGPARSMRTRLWLGWRLYGWLAMQLQAMARDGRQEQMTSAVEQMLRVAPTAAASRRDVLDPFGFDPSFFDHRLAAVIHAIGVGTVVAEGNSKNDIVTPFSSVEIEDTLIGLANRPTTAGPTGDYLGWDAPSNLPDIALWTLLALNSRSFTRLDIEARRRAVAMLPPDMENAPSYLKVLGGSVLLGCTVGASDLSTTEREEIERKVRSFLPSEMTKGWKVALLAVLLTTGMVHLQSEVEQLLVEEAKLDETSSNVAGLVAHLLVNVAPTALEARFRELLTNARKAASSEGAFVLGLARVIAQAGTDHSMAARHALLHLASETDGPAQEVVQELVRTLGLEENGDGNA